MTTIATVEDSALRQVGVSCHCFSGCAVIGTRDKILARRDTKTFGEVRLHRSYATWAQLAGRFRRGPSPGHNGHEVLGRD